MKKSGNQISILQLNIWNARSTYFDTEFNTIILRNNPDIICLQECYEEYNKTKKTGQGSRNDCEQLLRKMYWEKYEIFFSPRQTTWKVGNMGHWGNIIMWDRNLFSLIESRTKFILGEHDTYNPDNETTFPVNVQIVILKNKKNQRNILICNTHGWYGGKGFGKGDTPERLFQSEKILNLIKEYGDIPVILCGDLNLKPDSVSLSILENGIFDQKGNAIKNFNIKTTRTELYTEAKRKIEPHASYIITSNHVKQNSLIVDSSSTVSDHAPILLNCDI